jgi:hypothetical protein
MRLGRCGIGRWFGRPQDGGSTQLAKVHPGALGAGTGVVLIFVVMVGAGKVSGQATRPDSDASATWSKAVSSIAAAAAGHDAQALQSLIDPNCQTKRFNAAGAGDVSDFTDFATGTAIIGDHAYVFPDASVIADIARDIDSSALVSDYQRKELSIGDANQKSGVMRWIAQSLDAQDGELIAVIVLWDSRADTDDMHRPNFILIKAEKSEGGFKATQIVYGDPLQ